MAARAPLQLCPNLRRMMAVIIDQGDVLDDSLDIETPADPGKFLEPGTNQVRGNVKIERYGSCRSGVAHIVDSRGPVQMKFSKMVAAIGQAECTLEPQQLDFANDEVCLARSAIG